MKVNVKYFGEVVDRTNKGEEAITIEQNRLSELVEILNERYLLADLNLQFAVNEEIISDSSFVLEESDEVALLPPFAGG
ncbi:MoaD/ThiS family protein [Aegicerativicinus sediminis]|uniref:MoaD/ThiS family protein n=1 Tax=Aegicerativicinus sediminis TaxID=2893202 RepID=UPI001E2923E7|nr:MoaD/ThiS family protein [Aegicerativicinus sediminis]